MSLFKNKLPFQLALSIRWKPSVFLASSLLLLLPLSRSLAETDLETLTADRRDELCAECRLAADSIQELVRTKLPRGGLLENEIDLGKLKKLACRDILSDSARERCRSFYFTHLRSVEKWRQHFAGSTSYFNFVCIREHKYCCPDESFGPRCKKCAKCRANEQCQGEGTRSGNGTCVCKPGHSGQNCSDCTPGYYQSRPRSTSQQSKPVEPAKSGAACELCHKSCLYCRAKGPLGCEVCRKGFQWVPGHGCSDVDECLAGEENVCGPNTFCINTEGSHFCYECDRACDGCDGDGPDMCLRCAQGYKADSRGHCVAPQASVLPPEANYYRYAIYAGLCLCTCIILHNSIYLASLVGLSVALYIGFSEYVMSSQQQQQRAASSSATVPGLPIFNTPPFPKLLDWL